MKIRDWFWLKWNHYCTTHFTPLAMSGGPGGIGWYCETCRDTERTEEDNKLKRIKRYNRRRLTVDDL